MSHITLKGNPVNTIGQLPKIGTQAPDFALTATNLTEENLADFSGKKLVLNIFPSIDTPTCANSTRRFNQEAANLPNVQILCISNDLPFAMSRFCAAENIQNVKVLSGFRSSFGADYGLTMTDSPLKNLLSRAVIVIDENGNIVYTEQVAEIVNEPNYEAALQALK